MKLVNLVSGGHGLHTAGDLVLVKVFLTTSRVLWPSHTALWSFGFFLWKMQLVIIYLCLWVWDLNAM